jgi:hypothetical protein
MRDGLRVYDADTHVNPAAEVLGDVRVGRGGPGPAR